MNRDLLQTRVAPNTRYRPGRLLEVCFMVVVLSGELASEPSRFIQCAGDLWKSKWRSKIERLLMVEVSPLMSYNPFVGISFHP